MVLNEFSFWSAVARLPQAVALPVVGEGIHIRALRDCNQPVGGIIGIGARATTEQVAVVVPGVHLAAHIRQTIGNVVLV